MAETRIPLRFDAWTLIGVSPLNYDVDYANTGGYLPVGIAVADEAPDAALSNFRTSRGKDGTGSVAYDSGKNVYARALTSLPTSIVVYNDTPAG